MNQRYRRLQEILESEGLYPESLTSALLMTGLKVVDLEEKPPIPFIPPVVSKMYGCLKCFRNTCHANEPYCSDCKE